MSIEKTADGRYILKVGEVSREVTEDELYDLASKSNGANTKFEEANRLRSEAGSVAAQAVKARESHLAETIRKVQKGDVEAFEEYLDFLGVSGDEKYKSLADFRDAQAAAGTGGDDDDEPDTGEPGADRRAGGGKGKVVDEETGQMKKEFGEMKAVLQTLAQALTSQGLSLSDLAETAATHKARKEEGQWEAAFGQVEQELMKDQVLADYVKEDSPMAKKLKGLMRTLVKSRVRDDGRFTPDTKVRVIKDLRDLVKELGVQAGATSQAGLGISPNVALMQPQLEADSDLDKPMPLDDQNYDRSIMKTILGFLK